MDRRDEQSSPVPFGEYELLRKIGSGGMSEVFLARPAHPHRQHLRFALKRLLPDLAKIPNFVGLFREEVALAAGLRHPNLVGVHDSGEVAGQFFMATEYVEGLDCWKITRRLARQVKTLELDQVVQIVAGTLRGLDYLHNVADDSGRPLGIVHRDISPSNILVSRRGEVKLGDFGIALVPNKEVEEQRRARLRGKIRYLAPEQVRGLPLDHRSDLFAVGVLLAELIIGRSPFRGQTDIALLLNIRDVRLHLAEDLDERTPPALRALLLRALAREPDDRHPTAAVMLDELMGFAQDSGLVLDPLSLAGLIEGLLKPGDTGDSAVLRDTLTPLAHQPVGPRESRPPLEERTPSIPIHEYRVRRRDATEVGPLSYAELVEKVIHDRVSSDDLVSTDGGPYQPLSALSDLRRHLPMVTPTTSRIDGPGVPDRQGLVEDEGISAVFLLLARFRETGLMVVDAGAARKEVYVVAGQPVYASSNMQGELLGEYLVSRGVMTRGELEMALALLPRYEGHLGDTLIALELVDPLTLFEHITDQVRQKILNLFTWKTGSWSFFRGVECEKRVFPLAAGGVDLVREGIHRTLAERDLDVWWESMRSRGLEVVTAPEPPADFWPLSGSERAVLAAAGSPAPASEVLAQAASRCPEVSKPGLLRALHFVLTAGLVRARG